MRRKFFPLSPRGLLADLGPRCAASWRMPTRATTTACSALAYLFVMLDCVVLVLSGLVLWKSVQFPLLRELMGGYESARRVHFSPWRRWWALSRCTW